MTPTIAAKTRLGRDSSSALWQDGHIRRAECARTDVRGSFTKQRGQERFHTKVSPKDLTLRQFYADSGPAPRPSIPSEDTLTESFRAVFAELMRRTVPKTGCSRP